MSNCGRDPSICVIRAEHHGQRRQPCSAQVGRCWPESGRAEHQDESPGADPGADLCICVRRGWVGVWIGTVAVCACV
eukprot:1350575-Rhodomonas_salina.1